MPRIDSRKQLLRVMLNLLVYQRQQEVYRQIFRRVRKRRKNWIPPQLAPAIVQDSGEKSITGSSNTATLNGVGAGNLLITVATQETDATTFAVNTDTNSGSPDTWLKDQEKADATRGATCLQSAQNVVGGNTTVTVSMTGGVSKTFRFHFLEISGCVTTGVDAVSGLSPDAGGTNHSCSSAGINPTGPCIVFTSSSASNTVGTKTPGSGYTALTTAGAFTFWQYQIFGSAPSAEKGLWTSQNSVTTNGVIGAYKATAGAAFLQSTPLIVSDAVKRSNTW